MRSFISEEDIISYSLEADIPVNKINIIIDRLEYELLSRGLSNIDIKGKIELLTQALIAYDEYSSRKNKTLDELIQLTFYKLGYDGEYRVHKK